MNLRKKNLYIALMMALLYTVVVPCWGHAWRLHAFLGPLVIALYRVTPLQCLWVAVLSGVTIDLLSAPYPLGAHASAYALAATLLLRYKNYFFADTPSTLPLLVVVGSVASTSALAAILWLTGYLALPTWSFVLCDVLALSLADALLAVLLFTMPPLACSRVLAAARSLRSFLYSRRSAPASHAQSDYREYPE